jgi:cyclohexadienyl dehydratase
VLAEVRERGSVRIGTTGDYAPFSFVDGGSRRGIDIDLGERLAGDLGVRVSWIETTWPTLTDDLAAGKFDVAMSGVTVTSERAGSGCFTAAYVVTGKTVLARCDRAAQFTTLDAIDVPQTRVIVNPGGTNERFVDTRLRRAAIVRHPDNRTIFDALSSGAADLMITDALEAVRVARERPSLCTPIPTTFFETTPKAFYVPKDEEWRRWLDDWLSARRADGTVDAVLQRHGVRADAVTPPER